MFVSTVYRCSLSTWDVSFVIIQADFIFRALLIVDEVFPTKLKNLKQFNLIKNEGHLERNKSSENNFLSAF
jgi:hypothetical protein